MIDVPFDPTEELIRIEARITGPLGHADVDLVLDTGASVTLITFDTLDKLGYSARDGDSISVITTAIGRESGYLLRLQELRTLGHAFTDVRVHAHDLAETSGIDGLLGLDVLRHFNYEIRSKEGLIRVGLA
ncbi:MAG TPA: retropepsin-like aspartic protease [Polyangia bacterium]|jgi:predicted aspartyl protease|nr:retropepsin-like aspartic protease [Polyangia bacterium]